MYEFSNGRTRSTTINLNENVLVIDLEVSSNEDGKSSESLIHSLNCTPFIPNYKSFQDSWRVKHLKFDQNYRGNYKDF